MSKLTREQKIEIYTKRKYGETVISLSRHYPVVPKAKYKSYKGDSNGTVKNQLH